MPEITVEGRRCGSSLKSRRLDPFQSWGPATISPDGAVGRGLYPLPDPPVFIYSYVAFDVFVAITKEMGNGEREGAEAVALILQSGGPMPTELRDRATMKMGDIGVGAVPK